MPRFAARAGDCRILLKREDLAHTGSHKINNVLGQALLTKRMGKKRVIAETGAGQHGVATATAAALLGLDCVVYMGEEDTERQALNVARMRLLGAEVVPVTTGSRTLKDAINEAFRDWVTTVETTPLLHRLGDGAAPVPDDGARLPAGHRGRGPGAGAGHDGPAAGRGHRLRGRRLQRHRRLPRVHPRPGVRLIGCEAGGEGSEPGRNAATLVAGSAGVIHGMRTYLLQDADGQTLPTHSISAGLDYPGVGPEHAWLRDTGRASYRAITDQQAMDAFSLLCRTEGIIPAIESAHALAGALQLGGELGPDALLLVNLSGRGDKDVDIAGRWFGHLDVAGVRMSTVSVAFEQGGRRGPGRAGRLPARGLPDRGRGDRGRGGDGRGRRRRPGDRPALLRSADGRAGDPGGRARVRWRAAPGWPTCCAPSRRWPPPGCRCWS